MREVEAWKRSSTRLWVGLAGLAVMVLVSLIAGSPAPEAIAPPDGRAAEPVERAWIEHVRLVDEALARGDVSAAVRRWHDAYGAALSSRRPEALVASGEAFVRISAAAGTPGGGKPNARLAYLAALRLAERQQSVEGVLGVARAFDALGDRQVAEYCVRIADALAARQGRR
jgi:hypothetical protein